MALGFNGDNMRNRNVALAYFDPLSLFHKRKQLAQIVFHFCDISRFHGSILGQIDRHSTLLEEKRVTAEAQRAKS
jgi:hypothetical protein